MSYVKNILNLPILGNGTYTELSFVEKRNVIFLSSVFPFGDQHGVTDTALCSGLLRNQVIT